MTKRRKSACYAWGGMWIGFRPGAFLCRVCMFKSLHQEPAKVLTKKIDLFTPSMAQHTRDQMTGTVGDTVAFLQLLLLYIRTEPWDYHQFILKTHRGCRGKQKAKI